jgi:hypothetical protein
MNRLPILLSALFALSTSVAPLVLAETSPPGAEAAANLLRTQIDATVKDFLANRRPASGADLTDEEYISEAINREIKITSSGGDEKPQTVVQFLKKKKKAGQNKDRTDELEQAMASANASSRRELAITILEKTKQSAFNSIKQDLLWRSTITNESDAAKGALLDAASMDQLVGDYWWATTRLIALQ